MNQKSPIKILAAGASENILKILFEKWKSSKEGKGSSATTFQVLERVVKCSSRTLNDRLKELEDIGLVNKEGRNYSITSLGILFQISILRKIEMLKNRKRDYLEFDQRSDVRAWPREGCSIISAANKELLITTRQFKSLIDHEVHKETYLLAKEAANRGVKIYVIADPSIPENVKKIITENFGGELKYISSKLLENPPGILKPIFLDDFCHIMIADRRHWLALRPHKRENEHSGQRCLDDPVTAEYLSDIYWTFWTLADYIGK
jgi:predicted transcriptional regulator